MTTREEGFDEIVDLMDGEEWSADTLDAIADVVTKVLGRPLEGPS